MSKQLTHTGIPTAGIFGMGNAKTWNPVEGCENKGCHLHPVNTGECWAAQMCNRMAGPWAKSEIKYKGIIEINKYKCTTWYQKLKEFKPVWLWSQYRKEFPKERSCILVGYMTDIAFVPEWVQKIIDKIRTNNEEREKAGLLLHVFQFLTKDPTVYLRFLWPENCWLGFTATNQNEYDERWGGLPVSQNHVMYAYLEPLRGEINIKYKWLDWVIVGGGSTPLHPDWARSIKEQCIKLGIRFYFKSWGKWLSYWCPHDHVYKHTKAPKGILFNVFLGRTWEQFPEV